MTSRFTIAVHIVTLLAEYCDQPVTSALLAKSVNTNPVVIRRLLSHLTSANLITTTPGPTGGSQLSRPPHTITLANIYEAVETDVLFALHPQTPNDKCMIGAHIQKALAPVFADAQATLKESLAKTTINDILRRVKKSAAACEKAKK